MKVNTQLTEQEYLCSSKYNVDKDYVCHDLVIQNL